MRRCEINELRILRSFAFAQDDESLVRVELGNKPQRPGTKRTKGQTNTFHDLICGRSPVRDVCAAFPDRLCLSLLPSRDRNDVGLQIRS